MINGILSLGIQILIRGLSSWMRDRKTEYKCNFLLVLLSVSTTFWSEVTNCVYYQLTYVIYWLWSTKHLQCNGFTQHLIISSLQAQFMRYSTHKIKKEFRQVKWLKISPLGNEHSVVQLRFKKHHQLHYNIILNIADQCWGVPQGYVLGQNSFSLGHRYRSSWIPPGYGLWGSFL